MKKTLLLILISLNLFDFSAISQNFSAKYSYDLNGNRSSGQIVYLALKSASIVDETIESRLTSDTITNQSVQIFPNPVVDEIQIELKGYSFEESNSSNIQIEIFDSNGNSIANLHPSQSITNFDFISFTQGIYLVVITTYNKRTTFKVIKK